MELKKATRKKVKIKLNISGAAGAGKTMSALLMAKGLVGEWGKIAVIDTENSSASLYSHLGDFLTIELAPPFSPERYIEAIDICLKAGIECIIIDSSTHEWSGPGGCLEINELLAKAKYKGNTWSAWSETTPKHDAFITKILQAPCFIITCTRSKMETVMTEDKKVKKLGMKDMQRDGWEYELTISLSIDRDTHTALASKDRTELFEGSDPFVITEETGIKIKQWCETGEDEITLTEALALLAKCNTVVELTHLKSSLPPHVFNADAFRLAGKKRHELITAPPIPATETKTPDPLSKEVLVPKDNTAALSVFDACAKLGDIAALKDYFDALPEGFKTDKVVLNIISGRKQQIYMELLSGIKDLSELSFYASERPGLQSDKIFQKAFDARTLEISQGHA